MANRENQGLVCIGARVEPELADAVARLADSGDRSISREVRRSLIEHVHGGLPPSSRAVEGRGAAMTTAAHGGEEPA